MANNSMVDLRNYFSVPAKPVTMKEFSTFWQSLEEREKEYYRTASLG